MHHLLHSHVFIYLYLESHLGTLDAPRGGHDVELNPKIVLVDLSWKWKDWTSDRMGGALQASVI
jgi:hypothetical protein